MDQIWKKKQSDHCSLTEETVLEFEVSNTKSNIPPSI